MAAVPKDQKDYAQKKRGRQSRPRKNLAKQSKLPSRVRRNICLIRFPKSCHLQSCPLLSQYFKKQVRDNVLSLRMAKRPPGSFWAEAYRLMTTQAGGQKKQHRTHKCPDFLKAPIKATDKRHTKQKGAPVVKTAKPRRRYSDEEIFYRLAKPSMRNDAQAGPSGIDAKTLNLPRSVPAIPQPPAGALQPVLC